jgi:hypothetical protein
MENLSGQSTDENWFAKWVENVTVIHKLVSLKNFSVYWNPSDKFLVYNNTDELGKAMKQLVIYFQLEIFYVN